jgi:hypothetical protein
MTTSVSIAGKLTIDGNVRSVPFPLSQIIADVESKVIDLRIPNDGLPVAAPLCLSSDITEALVLVIYSPSTVDVTMTTSTGTPGPVVFKMRGLSMLTLAPDGGVVELSFSQSGTGDVTVTYAVVTAQGTTTPTWWADLDASG